jgi:hypothetical protein
MLPEPSTFQDDVMMSAWAIAAKHLTRGQKDVTRMIAEGIQQERKRCVELMQSALGSDAQIAVFVEDPRYDW